MTIALIEAESILKKELYFFFVKNNDQRKFVFCIRKNNFLQNLGAKSRISFKKKG